VSVNSLDGSSPWCFRRQPRGSHRTVEKYRVWNRRNCGQWGQSERHTNRFVSRSWSKTIQNGVTWYSCAFKTDLDWFWSWNLFLSCNSTAMPVLIDYGVFTSYSSPGIKCCVVNISKGCSWSMSHVNILLRHNVSTCPVSGTHWNSVMQFWNVLAWVTAFFPRSKIIEGPPKV